MNNGWLADQIKDAKKSLAKTARHCPYLFAEHARYMMAKTALAEAKKELEDAKAAWEKVRNRYD